MSLLALGSVAYNGGHFPSANGSIFIDLVDCKGTESRLLDCSHSDYADCTHNDEAGVSCPGIYIINLAFNFLLNLSSR